MLESVDTVVGYISYIELIMPIIKNKNIISSAMKQEIKRAEAAIDVAMQGKSCAVVSSGDSGIYAMAGLIFEMCMKKNIFLSSNHSETPFPKNKPVLHIEVVSGIPALCAGASLLGAPIAHDFASISLSDLLTPWEVIEQRVEATAKADFVIVLYNPKSKKRNWQLAKAREIILKYRKKNTPVGIVTSAMRNNQEICVTTLENLHTANVNMQTTVFVGNSASFTYLDSFMITPRGYSQKYAI